MKKWIQSASLLLAGLVLLSGCTAGQAASADPPAEIAPATAAQGIAARESEPPKGDEVSSANALPPGKLTLLMGEYMQNPDNEEGFYYADSPSGYGGNLFFSDYNTLEQRYLCEKKGCTHDSTDCLSYVDNAGGLYPFTHGESLYVSHSIYSKGAEEVSVLERRALDGTGGKVILEYPVCELQMETVYADDESLYFNAPDGFVRLDTESLEKTLLPNPFGEYAYITYLGALHKGNPLVLTEKEDLSHQLYAWNVETGQAALLHSWPAGSSFPGLPTPEGKGYYFEEKSGHLRCYDIATDTDTLVTDMFADQNVPQVIDSADGEEIYYPAFAWSADPLGNKWLVIELWFGPEDPTASPTTSILAYNLKTGETRDIPFGNFFNGYVHSMLIWGQTPHGLLVTEENRARTIHGIDKSGKPFSYESPFTVYALLDVEDYLNGEPNFRTITPVEYSGLE